jgi:ribosomal-protein-alanine N-acetyltransferase
MINSNQYFPNLESERLRLRQLTTSDADFVFRHLSNPSVTEYLMDEPPLAELSQAQEIIDFYRDPESKTRNRWGIELKSDKQLIGTCGYHKWDKRYFRAEIGYDLNPSFWGQHIMTEALGIVIKNGFEAMGLNRIGALVYIENVRSEKLLLKLGFQKEGILRDYFYLNGKFYDHSLMSLIKSDWKH